MFGGAQDNYTVITDTSCIILLDKIEALDLLHALYPFVLTTVQIANEFGKPLPHWIELKEVHDTDMLNSFAEKVDLGEASAIALALELTSPLLIIDDLKGRNLASQLQLNYTGTLGLLISAKQKGIIAEINPYFEKIKLTDFRITPALLNKILKEYGE